MTYIFIIQFLYLIILSLLLPWSLLCFAVELETDISGKLFTCYYTLLDKFTTIS